ncbi:hypothetical protein Bhyg_06348, partial [Pseudolycoriella hygida]
MRTKSFLIGLCGVVITSALLILFSSAGQQNENLKNIVSQTHQQIREFQENLVAVRKKLDIDVKYLELLGFTQPIYNGTRYNFTIVTYIQSGQTASAILLSQNIALKLPNEVLLIYNLGLSEDDTRALSAYCNNSKCSVITYEKLTEFPSYVNDDRTLHAFRPLIIKDALTRSKTILFMENSIRVKGSSKDISVYLKRVSESGVLGWTTRQAVSTRTHPKMFEYFQTDPESFLFVPMVSLDVVIFLDTDTVNQNIMLPWIKCTLTNECIHPIGAQSIGCRYDKKPLYRYSGCHAYDASAFNIVLGLTWNFDETKYSTHFDSNLFYQESLEEATRNLENKRKNISDTSESFTDE